MSALQVLQPATGEKWMTVKERVDEAITPEALAKSAEIIKSYDLGTRVAFKHQMGNAFLAGLELNLVKNLLKHGEFDAWAKTNLPDLSTRSRSRYMAFEEALRPQIGHVANFRPEVLRMTNGELPELVKEEVSEAVYKLADGKRLTEFYRDLGVIKPKAKDGGFRPNAAAVEKWLKANHPDLCGTKFNDLSTAVQKAFKKQYKPEVDPQDIVKLAQNAVLRPAEELMAAIDDKNHIKLTDEQKPYLLKILKDVTAAIQAISKTKKEK